MVKYVVLILAAWAAVAWAANRGANMSEPCNGSKTVRIYNATTDSVETVDRVCKTDEEWKALLTPEQYDVVRQKGTERPFTGACAVPAEGKTGIYECAACGTDLFRYDAKFDSGTGWPSFWEPASELNVSFERDTSHGRIRTEVLCARCGAHLGHVFDDGPEPTGKRYCINAVALRLAEPAERERATFAAGCFWGVESAFRQLLGKGVVSTRVGYTGGHKPNPTYQEVCSHTTGHAEAVEVEYDPKLIGYDKLLDVFWSIHDPTTPDRQGPDVGSQYRSAIFYHSPEQHRLAVESRARLETSKRFRDPVVTEITRASEFYPAEDYHQQYHEKRGAGSACGASAER